MKSLLIASLLAIASCDTGKKPEPATHTLTGKVTNVEREAAIPGYILDITIDDKQGGQLRIWAEIDTMSEFRAKTGPEGVVMSPEAVAYLADHLGRWAAQYKGGSDATESSTTEHSR